MLQGEPWCYRKHELLDVTITQARRLVERQIKALSQDDKKEVPKNANDFSKMPLEDFVAMMSIIHQAPREKWIKDWEKINGKAKTK